ncbi:unnamed protein product [Rangifer tarandus platyrhynchus]|uniref:Uncharacterized protein n=2 Tax=Rangifer tarandus platyrhynchus TaxID=3082113 RepID=A0ACB0E3J7_RANTA|nr:unnamed protein product [Rangifer tarandus platyrhynchus]CAI9695183.1 unnamed protein product [Rangifer tarandus platyrhynchus]
MLSRRRPSETPPKLFSVPLPGSRSPRLAPCSRGEPPVSFARGRSGWDLRELGRGRPEARTSLRQRRGCAGPRDICRPRSRLTPRAPPQLPGRCHPPRSGCRLFLQTPRQLPRVLAHREARPRPERSASAGRDFGAGFLTFRPETHPWWAQPDSLHPHSLQLSSGFQNLKRQS